MTPKEKAKELIHIYQSILIDEIGGKSAREFIVKRCALIAAEEVINVACPDTFACKSYTGDFYSDQDYFIEVKKEIEKL